jgi:hypothetical protein
MKQLFILSGIFISSLSYSAGAICQGKDHSSDYILGYYDDKATLVVINKSSTKNYNFKCSFGSSDIECYDDSSYPRNYKLHATTGSGYFELQIDNDEKKYVVLLNCKK